MPAFPTVYTVSPTNDSTLAIEVLGTGLLGRKKKHIFFFENFNGQLSFAANNPIPTELVLTIDAASVVCRDQRAREKKRRKMMDFVREQALAVKQYPEIRYSSNNIQAKPLRGFVAAGVLQIRAITRQVKANITSNSKSADQIQLDGDAILRLSDFDLPRPSTMFGLAKTHDEATVHLLLWAAVPRTTENASGR